MKRRRSPADNSCKLLLTLTGLMITIAGVGGMRNVAVTIPAAVSPGDTVTLQCTYDLENDSLYTVKWYKGRKEFFRYIPKELPHTRVFPILGANVDISKSGPNEVVLRDVQLEMAGKYRCEVSADAPTFHTTMVWSYMHVVYLPEGEPKMVMEKQRYAVGDILRGNCTSPPSNPPANLTWFVNGKKMNESYLVRFPVDGDETRMKTDANGVVTETSTQRQVTVVGLELDIEGSSFQYGKVRIECEATMFQLYRSKVELVLEEERPRLASVLGTRESSLDNLTMSTTIFPDAKVSNQAIANQNMDSGDQFHYDDRVIEIQRTTVSNEMTSTVGDVSTSNIFELENKLLKDMIEQLKSDLKEKEEKIGELKQKNKKLKDDLKSLQQRISSILNI